MSLLTRLFGKPKKEIKEIASDPVGEKPPAKPCSTETTLRPSADATRITQKKPGPELSALELADQQEWAVKTLPVWERGDVILDTYDVEDAISGGMGHVYIANHGSWNVKLAIKSPHEMMLSDRDFFAHILRKADSWTVLGWMAATRSKKIIHRDIKPENILITKDGVLKITELRDSEAT